MPVLNPPYPDEEGGGGAGTGNVYSDDVAAISVLDRAEYDALPAKDPKMLYLIKG